MKAELKLKEKFMELSLGEIEILNENEFFLIKGGQNESSVTNNGTGCGCQIILPTNNGTGCDCTIG